MIRRHPILDAVVVALVLLGIAIVIGVATGDDSDDALTEHATSGAAHFLGDASSVGQAAYDIVLNNQARGSGTELWLHDNKPVVQCVTLDDPPSLLPPGRQRVISVTPQSDCPKPPLLVLTYDLQPHGGETFGQAVLTVSSFARAGGLPGCQIKTETASSLGCDVLSYLIFGAEVKLHD